MLKHTSWDCFLSSVFLLNREKESGITVIHSLDTHKIEMSYLRNYLRNYKIRRVTEKIYSLIKAIKRNYKIKHTFGKQFQ